MACGQIPEIPDFQARLAFWFRVPGSELRVPPAGERLARQEQFDTAETAVVRWIARTSRVKNPTAETAVVRYHLKPES
ncbi:MAG: hypothetical protein Kow00109_26190 [Acidobacteriota bacterium]